ncbi:MAG: response regulator, partial [Candidatus Omnitrophota bacterium]
MAEKAPKTILIVDDDPDICITTSSVLKKRGFIPVEARTAEDALAILEKTCPDLILTDVLLPEMNGYEFIKTVKASAVLAEVPVLVLTGRGQMKEAFDLIGVSGFITKPFSIDELLIKIDEVFGLRGDIASKAGLRKKILVVGRLEFKDVLDEILMLLKQFGCQTACAFAVPEALSKTIEFSPDAFVTDVQLDGHHSAELVNIVRHLPRFEEKPIVGFSYYRLASLNEETHRQKLLQIQEDAKRFQETGANEYIGRYTQQSLISSIKNYLLKNER